MAVTVYTSRPASSAPRRTGPSTNKGIQYEVHDVSTDEAALEHVKSLGYLQAPVVVTDDDHWSGFRPTRSRRSAPSSRDP